MSVVGYDLVGGGEKTRNINTAIWKWTRKEVDGTAQRQAVVVLVDTNARVGLGPKPPTNTIEEQLGWVRRGERGRCGTVQGRRRRRMRQ